MTSGSTGVRRKRTFSVREGLSYGVLAGAVWLSWEIIKTPLADRAAPELAVRLAPQSPEVLRRAAESEFASKRFDNALDLAAESLARSPFNSRALRVRGLAEAELGASDRADEMLTLAGNWSLRDDPAHAWLVEHRLRRGDYSSAFAHADTLARRRPDLYPSLFRLFTMAAIEDPRAIPVITRLLAAQPPWRPAFLDHLHHADEAGASVIGGLAIALEQTQAPLTSGELQQLYNNWVSARRFQAVRQLRTHLRRPPIEVLLQNGDFSTEIDEQQHPFGWTLGIGPGIGTAVTEDDLRPENRGFRLEYDGFASGIFSRQWLLLGPGEYILNGEWRSETPQPDMRVEWQVVCAETGTPIGKMGRSGAGTAEWKSFSHRFTIPQENCSAQWLQLAAVPGDRRTFIAAWFDSVEISPVGTVRAAD